MVFSVTLEVLLRTSCKSGSLAEDAVALRMCASRRNPILRECVAIRQANVPLKHRRRVSCRAWLVSWPNMTVGAPVRSLHVPKHPFVCVCIRCSLTDDYSVNYWLSKSPLLSNTSGGLTSVWGSVIEVGACRLGA